MVWLSSLSSPFASQSRPQSQLFQAGVFIVLILMAGVEPWGLNLQEPQLQ